MIRRRVSGLAIATILAAVPATLVRDGDGRPARSCA